MSQLIDIHRHPIKGFTAESMHEAELVSGRGLRFDRHFAFVSGNKEDQPVPGGWVQARTFLMLTLYPELAQFKCALSTDGTHLKITDPEGEIVEVTRAVPETFDAANTLLRKHFKNGPHGEVRLIEQSLERGNWDFSDTELSIINLATVRAISEAVGRNLEKERFRGNLYIDDLAPFEEFRWPGCRIKVGEAELDILRPIQRCAMTSTEPGTGKREVDVPQTMIETFGHNFCGVYARVATPGRIAAGSQIETVATDAFNPHDNLPERVASPSLWPRFVESADNDSVYAAYFSPVKNWPLPEAEKGQAFKTHPLSVDGKPSRNRIHQVHQSGWFVPRPGPSGALISGPYGRPDSSGSQ